MEIKKEMYISIKNNDIIKVKELLDNDKSNVNIETPFGSLLHVAAMYNRLDIAKLLINYGIDINKKSGVIDAAAIKKAATKGNINIVKYLICVGAELDTSTAEANPLFGAIYGNHIDIVELLIDNGINIGVKYHLYNIKNMDAYNYAIEGGNLKIANLIKEKMLEQGLEVVNIFEK
ncbi:ankyrin repeat domain-containing protein [Paraclostridium ghonii]|nr:ankyrin repeat domain-containing protein [Paeniclostridium ghonii]MCM0167971.1 ankyrin repeat domain-containing protein [Paeniclostridium ghonii]